MKEGIRHCKFGAVYNVYVLFLNIDRILIIDAVAGKFHLATFHDVIKVR